MEQTQNPYTETLNPTNDFETRSSTPISPNEPKDVYLFNNLTFLLFGIVMILPFNALIQSIGFLETNLPGRDIEFVVSTLTNVPVFTGQLIMLFLSRFFNTKITILFSLVIMAGWCISIPFLTEYITNNDALWIAIILVISLFCLFNGVLQSWGYGYASIFPQRIIASLSNGTGLSGVVIGVLRAISLVAFPVDNQLPRDPSLFSRAILYFSISTALCLILIGAKLISFQTKFILFHSKPRNNSQTGNRIDSMASLAKTQQSFTAAVENKKSLAQKSLKPIGEKVEEKASIIKIHNNHWINLWGILVNFVITFTMFPGLLLQANISFIGPIGWRIWFTIFLFTISDASSRILAGFFPLKAPKIWGILTLWRFGNLTVAFLSAFDVSFFGSDYMVVINIIVSASSLGYLVTSQIIMACTFPQPHEMEKAGKMVNIFLLTGIVTGSLISTFGLAQLF